MLGVEEQMKVIESGAMQIVPQEELKKKRTSRICFSSVSYATVFSRT